MNNAVDLQMFNPAVKITETRSDEEDAHKKL